MSNDWPLVKLGDVLELDLDRVPTDPAASYEMVGVYSFGKGLFFREPVHGHETSYKYFYRLKAEHIIMSQLFGWEGALALSSPYFEGRFVSPQFPTFLSKPELMDRAFLGWFITRPAFWMDLGTRTKGMGDRRKTLNPEALFDCSIPLPPLEEQKRIVAKIENLIIRVEEAKKLNAESVEEAEKVKKRALNHIVEAEKSTISNFGEVILSTRNGLSRRPVGFEEGPIVLRLLDVSSGEIDLKDPRRGVLSDDEIEKYSILEGNLLFVRVNGSKDIVGRSIPVRATPERLCYNDHLIKVELDAKIIDWRYVHLITNGPIARNHLEKVAITTAGQFTINQAMLKEMPIPVPPLSEQRRIVEYLDGLQAKVDELKRLQTETQKELAELVPSILDKAFKGKL